MKNALAILIALTLISAAARGAAPADPHLNVVPPGQVMQRTVAYLTGDGMHSMWYVVTSRKLAGKNMGKTPVYQWYLSFYAPDGDDGGKLVYQLPNSSHELLSQVTKARGAEMYFPMQDVKIVGAAEFEQPGVQDVVVWDRQAAADCGIADVTVFGANTKGQVEQRVHVENGCDLVAKIVKKGALSAVQLTGPYYGANAPLCCPTKPHATATLAYKSGDWKVTPNYFIISASLAAHR
ncbi:MAG TPA: hypothetical protein VKT72_08600 [Candidatus Baltobacteraceae bacterium]|nr:hypothetical protein [Candidatus Baltobacteraceae bacterium]